MASNLQVKINDETTAKQWLAGVMEINEEYYRAMEDASAVLTGAKDFMAGTVVDDLYNFGTNLLSAAKATFDAVNTIADTVNSVLNSVASWTTDVLGGLGRLASSLLGK